ncbi:hypothetical protein EXS73_03280 [Candidatus Pacearchaeota archaeon]|nr:hypothetical protein [Candidatus Pacearchaeota archaeon]
MVAHQVYACDQCNVTSNPTQIDEFPFNQGWCQLEDCSFTLSETKKHATSMKQFCSSSCLLTHITQKVHAAELVQPVQKKESMKELVASILGK